MTNVTEQKVEELTHFINGKETAGKSGRFGNAYNPSTGEVIAKVPYASREEVKEAIDRAKEASADWKRVSVAKRVDIIRNFRELLMRDKHILTELIGKESGKTYADAEGEIVRGIESVDLAINAPHLLKGDYSMNVGGQINAYTLKQPLGVVAAIAPFNFPVMVPLGMTMMAVAVGNSVILKPSEKVPHSALLLSRLWAEAGLPEGVWTVINGDKEAVDELIENPAVEAISFVGSTKIAEHIYHAGTKHNKRVAAFGGGKNHMVIMPDADLEQVANAFLGAAFGAASQRCMAISAAMPIGKKTAEQFTAVLKEKIEQLKVGSFDDQEADFGPVISKESKELVLRYIEGALAEGAELVTDGRDSIPNSDGFYVGPTLLEGITPDMTIFKEEVFGPVRTVVQVDTLEEAIKLINDHELGNGVTIYTNSGAAARKFTEEIEVGMVGVNVPIPIPVGYHNFGGWKRSRFGEGQMFGPDNARFYTKLKTISERWPGEDEIGSKTEFAFPSDQS